MNVEDAVCSKYIFVFKFSLIAVCLWTDSLNIITVDVEQESKNQLRHAVKEDPIAPKQ